ncbi:MAG: class I SAM-dependent methyltransferase [Micromonosporaceae bacterium]|nr:class I SAM-dependent methyltransferase [Micromonosporaceae bacterium]
MDQARRTLLDRLYAEGTAYDAGQPDRLRRRRNLEPDAAQLLTVVLRIAGARRVVEIGTSNGYSAIWLADAVQEVGGRVTTVDIEAWPGVRENLRSAGVSGAVDVVLADGGGYLAGLANARVDLLFLDAERVEYAGWWPHPARVLRPGGVLAVDNVLSHPDEVAPFLALVAADGGFVGTTATVGKGLYLAWRR